MMITFLFTDHLLFTGPRGEAQLKFQAFTASLLPSSSISTATATDGRAQSKNNARHVKGTCADVI